jgi:hypothetical protein
MSQTEGPTQDPVHQAIWQSKISDTVLPVDTAGDWETTGPGTNSVTMAAAQTVSRLNDNNYINLDDANDQIDLRPGVYEVTLDLILVNDHASIDADFGVAVTSPAGTVVYHLEEDLYKLVADSGVAGHRYSVSFMLPVSGSWSDSTRAHILQVAARTASATVSMKAGSRILIRRLGNNT